MANKSNWITVSENALKNNKLIQIIEILLVFFSAIVIIRIFQPLVGENPILRQSIVWIANIIMLFIVWLGIRLRGQGWSHFGVNKKFINLRSFLLSFVVFFAAVAGFVVGSIIMANITGIPESADMSRYNYLQGNLPMLLAALVAVFIVSSFGEEVIYRGFLITRIAEMGGNSKIFLKIAVLVSSVIFGLVHYEWGLMGIVQTGFMGLVLGISFLLVKRNLWILILAHAYMDAILMIQMYFGR
ncbi:MAG: type II CAAX endopeptidase family protein [Candidatus Neomarinimicrobiota bacterium]